MQSRRYDTFPEALAAITDKHGKDVLLDGQRLVGYVTDYLRGGNVERAVLRNAFTRGIPEMLENARNTNDAERQAVMHRAVKILAEDFGMAESVAETHLQTLTEALGWPRSQHAPTPEQAKPAPETKPAAPPTETAPKTHKTVKFGEYEWRVLEERDGKALLITDKTIEKHPYNTVDEDVTWETCSLRKYLNGEFFGRFSGAEKERIIETRLENNDNPWRGAAGGNATTDKVFCLSLDEVIKYFGDSGDLAHKRKKSFERERSDDRRDNFLYDQYDSARATRTMSDEPATWWVRTPGDYNFRAVCVFVSGCIKIDGMDVLKSKHNDVRPAMWVRL